MWDLNSTKENYTPKYTQLFDVKPLPTDAFSYKNPVSIYRCSCKEVQWPPDAPECSGWRERGLALTFIKSTDL